MATSAASHRLERRVADFIAAEAVLKRGERALLLLSGGADSMALLDLLRRVDRRLGLGLAFAALHVDYATRGVDSENDRRIAERGCADAGVEIHVVRLSTRLTGGDFQARARELRYRHAEELAAARGYDVIVTAHNRDDQAETVLYRLVKYATPAGLVGMRPREGRRAKPLLCLGAAEIREHCAREGITYGRDVSNDDTVYARNLLRHDVVPRLERLNPRLSETLADSALMAAAHVAVVAAATEEARRRVAASVEPGELVALDVRALARELPALQELVLHDVVRAALGGEALVGRRVVRALRRLSAQRGDGGRVSLRGRIEAARAGGRLVLQVAARPLSYAAAELSGAALMAAGAEGLRLCVGGRIWRLRLLPGAELDREAACSGQAFVALAGPPGSLVLRAPRRGERFSPLGLGAETTVARYLAAARVPAVRRSHAVVLDVDGVTAWVGYEGRGGEAAGRVAEACRVQESTLITLHMAPEDI